MQLRVARLCLDCEELHVDNACPRCASKRYAFLTAWLPSEERRRWKRQPAAQAVPADHGAAGMARALGRWLRGKRDVVHAAGPLTRASDHVANLNFDGDDPGAAPKPPRRLDPHFSKTDTR
jgi:hypothetical protein